MNLRPVLIKATFAASIGLTLIVLFGAVFAGRASEETPGLDFGRDFAVFHAAGLMVLEGNGAEIYEPDSLNARMMETTGREGIDTYWFGSPPFLGLMFVPLALLPFGIAYAVFMLAGIWLFGWAAGRTGLSRVTVAVALLLVSLPAYLTFRFGQMGFWVGALLLGVTLALRSDRQWTAGLLLGLLAFKPFYAIGIAVWWLLRARSYRRAILGSVCSVAALCIAGLLVSGGWSAYLATMSELGGGFMSRVATSGASLYEMFYSLVPSSTVATVLWAVSSAAIVGWFAVQLRRWADHMDIVVSLAVVVGLLVSPRTGWYDLVLLGVPAVLVWERYRQVRPQTVVAGAWVYLVTSFGWFVAVILESAFGVFVQPTPVILGLVVWWWVREAADMLRPSRFAGSEYHPEPKSPKLKAGAVASDRKRSRR